MTKKVLIRVCGVQRDPDGGESTSSLACLGTLERREGGWHIAYEEADGDARVQTELRVTAERAALTRTGAAESRMLFVRGERRSAFYALPFGRLPLETELTELSVRLNDDGGTVELHYHLYAKGGGLLGHNRLTLDISPR